MKTFSSRFSSNSEAFASELLENLEDMFPLYDMYSDVFGKFFQQHSTVLHVARWYLLHIHMYLLQTLFINETFLIKF